MAIVPGAGEKESISSPNDELAKLRARVKELEAALDAKTDDKTEEKTSSRRIGDAFADIRDAELDAANRVFRGMTMASAEFIRAVADTVSSVAGNVSKRNDSRKGKGHSVWNLVTRLPEDIATSIADAVDDFAEIPSGVADRYSKAYRDGEKVRVRS